MTDTPASLSSTEAELRRTLHGALARSRDALLDCPDPADLAGAASAEELEERFDDLATSLAEAACAATAMRSLDDLSRDGALVVGSADVAIAALRAALASFSAELDAAREDAA